MGSPALKCIASRTTVSSAARQSTATIKRIPGKPYGIHVSACVHARRDAASSAGQITGIAIPDGHTATSLAASHRIAMATVP